MRMDFRDKQGRPIDVSTWAKLKTVESMTPVGNDLVETPSGIVRLRTLYLGEGTDFCSCGQGHLFGSAYSKVDENFATGVWVEVETYDSEPDAEAGHRRLRQELANNHQLPRGH